MSSITAPASWGLMSRTLSSVSIGGTESTPIEPTDTTSRPYSLLRQSSSGPTYQQLIEEVEFLSQHVPHFDEVCNEIPMYNSSSTEDDEEATTTFIFQLLKWILDHGKPSVDKLESSGQMTVELQSELDQVRSKLERRKLLSQELDVEVKRLQDRLNTSEENVKLYRDELEKLRMQDKDHELAHREFEELVQKLDELRAENNRSRREQKQNLIELENLRQSWDELSDAYHKVSQERDTVQRKLESTETMAMEMQQAYEAQMTLLDESRVQLAENLTEIQNQKDAQEEESLLARIDEQAQLNKQITKRLVTNFPQFSSLRLLSTTDVSGGLDEEVAFALQAEEDEYEHSDDAWLSESLSDADSLSKFESDSPSNITSEIEDVQFTAEEIEATIAALEEEIIQRTTERDSALGDVRNKDETILKLQNERDSFCGELMAKNSQVSELTSRLAELSAQYQETLNTEKQLEKSVIELQKEHDERIEMSRTLRSGSISMSVDVERVELSSSSLSMGVDAPKRAEFASSSIAMEMEVHREEEDFVSSTSSGGPRKNENGFQSGNMSMDHEGKEPEEFVADSISMEVEVERQELALSSMSMEVEPPKKDEFEDESHSFEQDIAPREENFEEIKTSTGVEFERSEPSAIDIVELKITMTSDISFTKLQEDVPRPRVEKKILGPTEEPKPFERPNLRHIERQSRSDVVEEKEIGEHEIIQSTVSFKNKLAMFRQAESKNPGAPKKDQPKLLPLRSRMLMGSRRSVTNPPVLSSRGSLHDFQQLKRKEKKVRPLKPRRKGYMKVIQTIGIDEGILERRPNYFFCLDGLPSQTNLDRFEPDAKKDRSSDRLVPFLFFFESDKKYREFVLHFGGLRRRSVEFQREFARNVMGLVKLENKTVGWDENGTFDEELLGEHDGRTVFIVENEEIHELECETTELRNKWLTGLAKLIRASDNRAKGKTELFDVDEGNESDDIVDID